MNKFNFVQIQVSLCLYLMNGFSHHYQLGKSTFIFRGVRSDFYFLYPPQNEVLGGILFSACPSFRDSVNILTSLLNNLSSFCLICFKFSPHLHHQTIHVWYEFRGQRVSIARVMGLFKSSYNMFAIVHTL